MPGDERPDSWSRAVPVRDIVVVGASAGGVDALMRLVAALPSSLPAAVLVVLHLAPNSRSNLAAILSRAGGLPAAVAESGMPLETGRILCAPPDHHLTVTAHGVHVSRGPHENLHRPSVDVLFRSAALHHRNRVCGVILSGALDDGTSGMRVIRAVGGQAIVQDPDDAAIPSMPASVIEAMEPDAVLTAEEIGRRLPELLDMPLAVPAEASDAVTAFLDQEVAMSTLEPGSIDGQPPGEPSPFGCPECGGVLWEVPDGKASRFRCRVGHAYTARALMAAEDAQLEDALWAAVRAIEEQEDLARRLLDRGWASGADRTRTRLEQRMHEARRRAEVLRTFLLEPTEIDSSAAALRQPRRPIAAREDVAAG